MVMNHDDSVSDRYPTTTRGFAKTVFLMSVLRVNDIGSILYVDGPMIAYWSRLAMHKGKITMLGRIMAGSQAVVAHNQGGQAVFVEYYAPDIHVSQVISECPFLKKGCRKCV
jgi:hypothetical protein